MALAMQKNEIYTYADYLSWPQDERWELIDGEPFMMSPAPSRRHQEIAGVLHKMIAVYLENRECSVYFFSF